MYTKIVKYSKFLRLNGLYDGAIARRRRLEEWRRYRRSFLYRDPAEPGFWSDIYEYFRRLLWLLKTWSRPVWRPLFAGALLLAIATTASGVTVMLTGPTLAISAATNAAPIVLTTATNTLQTNDWVLVTGVQGNPAANGIWQCSAVSATSCTLSGSAGGGTYTQGGVVTPLGARATTTSPYYDITKADKAYVLIWSPGGGVATVTIEGSPQPGAASPGTGPTTPNNVLATVTNPAALGTYTVLTTLSNVRVNLSAWTSGTIYATLEAYRAGQKIW